MVLFFVLAYLLAWGCWIPLLAAARGWISLPWDTHMPGLVAPAIAAFIVTAAGDGFRGLSDLLARMFRWRVGIFGAAIALSPLAIFAVVAALVAPFAGWPSWADLGHFPGVADIGPVGVLLVLVAVNGLGEETGWRGFAHDRLRPRYGFRRAVMIVAVLWAGWHLPLFFFHEGFEDIPIFFLPGWFLGIAAGSVILGWIYDETGSSIMAVAVWHGSYNWVVATDASSGAIAPIVTAVVIAFALLLTRTVYAGQEIDTPAQTDSVPGVEHG